MRLGRELSVVVALIFGIGAVVWLLRSDAADRLVSTDGELDPTGFDSGQGAVENSAELAAEVGEFEASGEDSTTVRRVAVDDVGSVVPGPRLLVVDARSEQRTAVANAEVFWVESEDVRQRRSRVSHDAELALQFGQRGRSDEAGRFDLPVVARRMLIVARIDGALGFRQIWRRRPGAERRQVLIELRHDLLVTARVFDRAGHPASGVPVALFEHDRSRRRLRLRLQSGADGRVAIPHLQLHRRTVSAAPRSMSLAPHVPLAEPASVEFAGDAPPSEEIRLELPATGAVEIAVQGPAGRPLGCPGNVVLQIAGRTDGGDLPAMTLRRFLQPKPFGVDVVCFPDVGLGLKLFAKVELDDDDFSWRSEHALGPRVVDRVVTLAAPMPAKFGLLVGRVVVADPGGPGTTAASDGVDLSMLLSDRSGRIEGEKLALDRAGRFELPFRLRAEPKQPIALVIRSDFDLLEASRGLSGLLLGHRTELGDFVLGAADLLAFGRIVDDLDDPIEGARIVLQRHRDVGKEGSKLGWIDEAYVVARTNSEGRYELHGAGVPGPRQRIDVRSRGRVRTSSPPFVPGAEVDLTVTRNGQLSGEVQAPAWLRARALELTLQRQGGRPRSTHPRLSEGVGTFRIAGLIPADDYDFVVTLVGFDEPLLRLERVRIQPGEQQVVDPRITSLDLTNSIYRYRLRAQRPNGQFWRDPGAPLLVRLGGEDRTFAAFRWRRSSIEFYCPQQRVEVVAVGKGVVPIERVLVHGQHTLRFEQTPISEIELVGIDSVPSDVTLRVEAIWTGSSGLPDSVRSLGSAGRGRPRKFSLARFVGRAHDRLAVGERVARIALSRSGTYRVRVRAILSGAERTVARVVGQLVRVAGEMAPARVRFEMAPATLQEMLADLRTVRAR